MYVSSFSTTWQDYPSPEDSAVVVFFAGCNHRCKGCHNVSLQSMEAGLLYTAARLYEELKQRCRRERTNKVVLEGGDPLFWSNVDGVKWLLEINKELDICIYTGYTVQAVKLLKISGFTYLKCGKYVEEDACLSGKTELGMSFASQNQRLYDSNFHLISSENYYWWKKGENNV